MSFPLVVQVAPTIWSGFIDIQSSSSAFPVQQFQIRISKDPRDTAFKSSRLHATVPGFDVDSRLFQMLAPHSAALQRSWRNAMAQEASFLSSFLSDVSDLIEKALDHDALGAASTLAPPSHDHYERILKEIEAIGWNCVIAADASLMNLTLDIRFNILSILFAPICFLICVNTQRFDQANAISAVTASSIIPSNRSRDQTSGAC
jgi:hypothetical protein